MPPSNEHAEIVRRTEAFLREHYSECVLMPTKNNDPFAANCPGASKQPGQPHVGRTAEQLWSAWDVHGRANHDRGLLILLRAGLIVIDVDDMDLVDVLEGVCPELTETATQATAKGRHYFFRRTPECDRAEVCDQARTLAYDNGEVIPLDIKSRCSTGTGGVISVVPSPGKRWLRTLYDFPPLDLPEAMLELILTKRANRLRNSSSRLVGSSGSSGSGKGRGSVPTPRDDGVPYPDSARDELSALLMNCLDIRHADDYNDWVRVGMALRNEHEGLLKL